MRKFKTLLVLFTITTLLVIPSNIASALQMNNNMFDIKEKLQLPYISRHEVVKAVPIYRVTRTGEWYNAGGTHIYTVNKEEFNYWMTTGKVVDDGFAGYISPVPLPYTSPLHNMVKNSLEQFFAPTGESRDGVIIKYNYEDYGVLGYIVPLEDSYHGNAEMLCWYKGNRQEAKPKYGLDVTWNADHYYNAAVKYVDSDIYSYEGPAFRCWNEAAVLQEINVLFPAGGEALTAGDKADIKWSTLIPDGSINLYYSTDGGASWGVIQEGLENNGIYTWTVPNEVTGEAIVEARWTYAEIDGNCFDQSDKYFTIKQGAISPGLVKPKLNLSQLLKPATPTSLTASSGIGQKQPSLSWKDNATNETGYIVERKEGGGIFSKLTETAANTVKYVDNTAKAGVKYVYRVKAVNGMNASNYSNEAAGSVLTLPEVKPPVQNTLVSMLFTLNQNTYLVNGVTKTMDVSPVSIEGRTMLPIRFAADPLDAVTTWDGTEQKVTVTLGATKLELWIGSNNALLNGSAIQIDPQNPQVKPLIISERTMLPMRFVTEKLGCGIEWLPDTEQIKVTYPNTWLDPQPEPPLELPQFKF